MKSVGLFEAKTKLSEICASVAESGDEVLITKRGQPYVKLVRVENTVLTLRERMAEYGTKYPDDPLGDEPDFELPPRSREIRPNPLEDT